MKIAIEAQRIFRKKKHGMDMVALELIRELMLLDKTNQYVIFVQPDEDRCLQSNANFQIVELVGGSYPQWEQIALPKAVKEHGCELLHCTSNTAPIRCSVPLVITLHDIIYLESLRFLTAEATNYQKVGNLYRRWNVPRVVKRASRVITVSEFERVRIADFLKLDNKKLMAIYNGVSRHFKPTDNADELKRVLDKYKLPQNYVLFLGNTDPKKNTLGVLEAFGKFKKENPSDVKLVMPDYDTKVLSQLLENIGYPNLINDIHLTGYIVNTDLPAIYQQAKLFLYPSLRESFGIPILEAMACEVPVITSNAASMPEVSGGAALLVDPTKPNEIADAMQKIVNSNTLRQALISKGTIQAAKFSWQNMATDVLKVYQEVIKSNT